MNRRLEQELASGCQYEPLPRLVLGTQQRGIARVVAARMNSQWEELGQIYAWSVLLAGRVVHQTEQAHTRLLHVYVTMGQRGNRTAHL